MITAICPAITLPTSNYNVNFCQLRPQKQVLKAYQSHTEYKNISFGISKTFIGGAALAVILPILAFVIMIPKEVRDSSNAHAICDTYSPQIKDNALRVAIDMPNVELTMPKDKIPRCALECGKWFWGTSSLQNVLKCNK